MAGKKKKKKYRFFWFFVNIQILLMIAVLAAIAWYYLGGYAGQVEHMQQEAIELVRNSTEETFRGNQTSFVYDADGNVISTLKGSKESYYLEMKDIPVDAVAAIISIEDKKFYRHNGIDYKAIMRAVKAVLKSGEASQGGSTITMQLARNIFLTQEKTWQRKVEEMFIARGLEEKYSKDKILEFYLNNIYFGNGYYGIQSASRGYFDRDVSELSLSETAFLCAIPNNPTLYDPVTNKSNTISRRDRILENMRNDGKISEMKYAEAVVERITLKRPEALAKNDYVETYTYYCAARALMENEDFEFRYTFNSPEEEAFYDEAYNELYTECQKKLYTAGYRIYTSFDLNLQEELQSSVNDTLESYTDVNEEGVYTLQASSVCIDNETGYVKAIVGGREQDFAGYTLNRAYQSFRQSGSAIKPLIVYTPSFERNYTPSSIVVDEPIEDGPKNSNGTYKGAITVRAAVENSVNTIAWKLYEELTPKVGLSYLEAMNFARLEPEDYSMATALGGFTKGMSALEMAAGYAAIENDGIYRTPTCIVKILDASGNEIYASEQEGKSVYEQNAARMMTDVLSGVFTSGTARGLGLGPMACAGKTGTTNDQKDGWFVGYTRYYTTSVWVGYDMPKTLDGLMGSTYPGTIWQNFMKKAHENLEPMPFLPYVDTSESVQEPEETEEEEELPPEDDPEDGIWEGEELPEEETNDDPEEGSENDNVNQPENGSDGETGNQPDTGNQPEGGTENQPGTGTENQPGNGTEGGNGNQSGTGAESQPPVLPENGTQNQPESGLENQIP